jgi:formamidopyrimidine-DNA glycosylase
LCGYNRPAVPELPDLAVVVDALHASLAGRHVTEARSLSPLAVRGTPAELGALTGQRLARVRRRGKFVIFELERDRVIVSPMLTGRFGLAAGDAPDASKAALVLDFGPRRARPRDAAAWTHGARWLPGPTDQPAVRYRDPSQMGKVYLLPAGIDRSVPGMGPSELGPDADDPTLTLAVWQSRIRRHPGELKNLLRNQAFVAGIGNAYSDEILWSAGLLPFRRRASLAPDETDRLFEATRDVLHDAIEILRKRVPPTFERQVRDFLAVHLKGGQACPRCGARISEISPGGIPTSFCRGCQR